MAENSNAGRRGRHGGRAAQMMNVQLQDRGFCAILKLKPRDGLLGNPRFVNMVIAALEYRRLRFERV